MILCKAVIEADTPFVSELQSDTFFAAYCWKYRDLFSEEELEAMLSKEDGEPPEIIFSNAFPHNTLPRPMGVYDLSIPDPGTLEKSEARKAYAQNKKVKNKDLITLEGFDKIQRGLWRDLPQYYRGRPEKIHSTTHTMVKRHTPENDDSETGKTLYTVDAFCPPAGQQYDLYFLTDQDPVIFEPVIKDMLLSGIGGRRSRGRGIFHLVEIADVSNMLQIENANGFVTLSNFIPDAKDPTDGWFKTLIKNGKVDREYKRQGSPFKKPMMYIQAGALFKDKSPSSYYGTLTRNVSTAEKVLVNTYTIALPVRIPA